MQLWTQGELKWVREESLANLVVAEFVELPEQVASESSVYGTNTGFFPRITRQLFDARVCVLDSYHQGIYLQWCRIFRNTYSTLQDDS